MALVWACIDSPCAAAWPWCGLIKGAPALLRSHHAGWHLRRWHLRRGNTAAAVSPSWGAAYCFSVSVSTRVLEERQCSPHVWVHHPSMHRHDASSSATCYCSPAAPILSVQVGTPTWCSWMRIYLLEKCIIWT